MASASSRWPPWGHRRTPPLVIPAKAGIHGGKGRVLGVRLGPTSQAPRPHGSRDRDTNMDSRFRGNDGRGGVSASSRWPPSDRRRTPLVPTEAGIGIRIWIPAFAGMTEGRGVSASSRWSPSDRRHSPLVIPAKAGIQGRQGRGLGRTSSRRHRPFVPTEAGIEIRTWIPAFAGMTEGGRIRLEPMAFLGPTSQPPSSFPRKRESRAGKDGALASASDRRHRPFVPMGAGSGIRIWIPAFERVKESWCSFGIGPCRFGVAVVRRRRVRALRGGFVRRGGGRARRRVSSRSRHGSGKGRGGGRAGCDAHPAIQASR